MANGSPDVSLDVLNDTKNEPVIYIGQDTGLSVSLTNNSNAITLTDGSALKIFLPMFFVAAEVEKMNISLSNWTFTRDPADLSLELTYNGSSANWDKGQKIVFTITGVKSNASPTIDSLQINFDNMGEAPSQVLAPLTLSHPPADKASLHDVVQVTLDNQGSVLISTETDPLRNKLFLNFKNISTEPLYNGKSHWSGTPQVMIMFVYGNTSGALAPDDKVGPPIGSAWNIKGEIDVDQTGGWQIVQSPTTGDHPHPRWTMTPINTNLDIIGTGEHANVTFAFSQIVSLTAPGHTQAIVQFSGFMKDENTKYDDTFYIVDIVKQNPPPTRGLLHFFGEQPLMTVTDPDAPINIQLGWAMLNVAKIHLLCSSQGVNVVKKSYPNPDDPLIYDSITVQVPAMKESGAIFFTLQAFNGNGGYLNSVQFTVFVNALMFFDRRDGKVYPAVLLNNQMWMAANLAHTEAESYAYNDNVGNEKEFGRLYTASAASTKPQGQGWRIPSRKDWQGLIDKYGANAYKELMLGGTSGFDAKLGGFRTDSKEFRNLKLSGYYRTTVDDLTLMFISTSQTVALVSTFAGTYALSIRYVKDL